MSWMIGVDVGGTFTDFFAFEEQTDRIVLHKVASTPGNPAEAVILGLHELSSRHGIDLVGAGSGHADQRRRDGERAMPQGLEKQITPGSNRTEPMKPLRQQPAADGARP